MTSTQDTWPAGATWVFQGTVAEDATAGTHVTSLTVTPGAGNEFILESWRMEAAITAGTRTTTASIDDGTNELIGMIDTKATGSLTNGQFYNWPNNDTAAAPTANIRSNGPFGVGPMTSGTMRLVLQMTSATVSLTNAFSVTCRIKGGVPTATLADTVGTPVLTTNTNKVF